MALYPRAEMWWSGIVVDDGGRVDAGFRGVVGAALIVVYRSLANVAFIRLVVGTPVWRCSGNIAASGWRGGWIEGIARCW